jgi:hypothetical protein
MTHQQHYRIYKDTLGKVKAELLKPGTPEPDDIILRVHLPIGPIKCIFFMTNMSSEEALRLGQFSQDLQQAVIEETHRVALRENQEVFYMLVFQMHPLDAKKYERRLANQLEDALKALDGWLNPVVLRDGIAYRYDLVVSEKRIDETREAIAAILKKHGIKQFTFEPNTF